MMVGGLIAALMVVGCGAWLGFVWLSGGSVPVCHRCCGASFEVLHRVPVSGHIAEVGVPF